MFKSLLHTEEKMAEFIAVVFLDAGARAGDYMNNALDLVFNFCGTLVASIMLVLRKRIKQE